MINISQIGLFAWQAMALLVCFIRAQIREPEIIHWPNAFSLGLSDTLLFEPIFFFTFRAEVVTEMNWQELMNGNFFPFPIYGKKLLEVITDENEECESEKVKGLERIEL